MKNIISKIQNEILKYHDIANWKDFQNSLSMGDCQFIASLVLSICKKYDVKCTIIKGNIITDNDYIDENNETQNKIFHHWNKIGKYQYDFAKNTLKGYIELDLQNVDFEK